MTDTVIGSDSTPPGSSLAQHYGAAQRFHIAYGAPQQATSKPQDDPSGEVAVSDSNPPGQSIGLPFIPSGSTLFPPAVATKKIDLTAALAGRGVLGATLTVVPAKAPQRKKVKRPKIKPTTYVAQYRIAGEMFYVEVKSRRTYLRHPKWSLMGAGKTLANAEVALLEEAGLVVRVFGKMAAAELDEEAERMLNFARRIA